MKLKRRRLSMNKRKIFRLPIFLLTLCFIMPMLFMTGCGSSSFDFTGSITLQNNSSNYYNLNLTVKVPYNKNLTKVSYTIEILDKNGKVIKTEKKSYSLNAKTDEDRKVGDNYEFINDETIYEDNVKLTAINVTNFKTESSNEYIYAILGSIFAGLIAAFLISFFVIIKIKENRNPEKSKEEIN